jgi:hypothetical protein
MRFEKVITAPGREIREAAGIGAQRDETAAFAEQFYDVARRQQSLMEMGFA